VLLVGFAGHGLQSLISNQLVQLGAVPADVATPPLAAESSPGECQPARAQHLRAHSGGPGRYRI
jgi:hypothetical protein